MGPECSLDAAEMADSVDGASAESSCVGSAMTSVDCERWWNALIGGRRHADRRAMLIVEAAVGRMRDNMMMALY